LPERTLLPAVGAMTSTPAPTSTRPRCACAAPCWARGTAAGRGTPAWS